MAHWLAASREWQVCGRCFELRGPFVWRLKGRECPHVQECACEQNRRVDGQRPETWLGFDFNTVAELCQACGCQVLDSGSRFSVWLCSDCKQRALALNAEEGRPLVPIGRHSIMHGVALQTQPPPTGTKIESFVTRFGTLIRRMQRLDAWGHAVVRRNLVTMGRGDAISGALADYLEAVRSVDSAERCAAMVATMALDDG
jgi:hypothetical protein